MHSTEPSLIKGKKEGKKMALAGLGATEREGFDKEEYLYTKHHFTAIRSTAKRGGKEMALSTIPGSDQKKKKTFFK